MTKFPPPINSGGETIHPGKIKYPQMEWDEDTYDFGHQTAIMLTLQDDEGDIVRRAVRIVGPIDEIEIMPTEYYMDGHGETLYRYDPPDEEGEEGRYYPAIKVHAKTRPATREEILARRMSLVESLADWMRYRLKNAKRMVAALDGKFE